MDKIKILQQAYIAGCRELGFLSDAEFVEAWGLNPEKYSRLFSIRMQLISLLSA